MKSQIADLTKSGRRRSLIVDVRRDSRAARSTNGTALARLFVAKRHARDQREPKAPSARNRSPPTAGDGAITLPVVVLVDTGTSGAAEVFAAALAGNKRADLVGEHTIGRAADCRS